MACWQALYAASYSPLVNCSWTSEKSAARDPTEVSKRRMPTNPDNTQWGPARRIDRPAKCITIHLTYAPEGSNLRYFPKIRSMPVKEALPERTGPMRHRPDENSAAHNRGIDG